MRRIGYILIFVFFSQGIHAQLLDSVSISRCTVYREMKEALKDPNNVYVLRLKGKLEKLPKSILKLKNLNRLDLSRNKFTEIPKELEQLEFLQVLDMERNKIDYLGPDITLLKNLNDLNLGKNELIALPIEIGNLKKLEKLNVWGNPIGSFPEELKQLSLLRQFDLRVIQINEKQQKRLKKLLPNTKIYFSIPCNCN